jgi:hypothetical protein
MFDMSQAICQKEKDINVFFPGEDDVYDPEVLKYAKSVCMQCPIKMECRQEGIRLDAVGVWGGLTEKERRRVSKGTDKVKLSGEALKIFKAINAERSLLAATADIPLYKKALSLYGEGMPDDFRRVLEARIKNPTLSLTKLGDMLGMRKDAVSGKLRRTKVAIVSEKQLVWKTPQ